MQIKQPFENGYCGNGKLKACQQAIWDGDRRGRRRARRRAGHADPAAWRSDAARERISFVPGLLPTTMRYTNRPSGIQQVISFDGHR